MKEFLINLICSTPKRDIHKLSQCTLELSIVRKTAMCRVAFDTSFSPGLDQCHQSRLRDGIPLQLKELEQLSEVCCWGMIVMNTAAEDLPEVLDGYQIRGTGRPVHLSNLMLLNETSHHPSAMGSGVVIQVPLLAVGGGQCAVRSRPCT